MNSWKNFVSREDEPCHLSFCIHVNMSWVNRIHPVFYRVVPGSETLAGMRHAGVGGILTFGGSKPKIKLPKMTPFKDQYLPERLKGPSSKETTSIFEEESIPD